MATIVIERGEKSYSCWNYLKDNSIAFSSYRLFREVETTDNGVLAFDIVDECMAVECALRFG